MKKKNEINKWFNVTLQLEKGGFKLYPTHTIMLLHQNIVNAPQHVPVGNPNRNPISFTELAAELAFHNLSHGSFSWGSETPPPKTLRIHQMRLRRSASAPDLKGSNIWEFHLTLQHLSELKKKTKKLIKIRNNKKQYFKTFFDMKKYKDFKKRLLYNCENTKIIRKVIREPSKLCEEFSHWKVTLCNKFLNGFAYCEIFFIRSWLVHFMICCTVLTRWCLMLMMTMMMMGITVMLLLLILKVALEKETEWIGSHR